MAGSRSSQVMPRVPQEADRWQKKVKHDGLRFSRHRQRLMPSTGAVAERALDGAADPHQTQQKQHEGNGLCFKQMKCLPPLLHHLPASPHSTPVDLALPAGLEHRHSWCKQRWL